MTREQAVDAAMAEFGYDGGERAALNRLFDQGRLAGMREVQEAGNIDLRFEDRDEEHLYRQGVFNARRDIENRAKALARELRRSG
jgi:hypothetical protein